VNEVNTSAWLTLFADDFWHWNWLEYRRVNYNSYYE
jgi:hypothetical protein